MNYTRSITLPISEELLEKLETLCHEKNASPFRGPKEWSVDDIAYVALVLAVDQRIYDIEENRRKDRELSEYLAKKESVPQ